MIRPLVFVTEEWTNRYTLRHELTTVGCVCGDREGPRSEIRAFLADMENQYTSVSESVRAALENVNSYTLVDSRLRMEGADDPAFADIETLAGI